MRCDALGRHVSLTVWDNVSANRVCLVNDYNGVRWTAIELHKWPHEPHRDTSAQRRMGTNRAGRQPAEAAGRKCVAPAPSLTKEAHVMRSKAATITAPARGSRKVGGPIRAVMVREIFAVAERFWSNIDALATRLDPADRPAIVGLAITALADTRGLPPAAARGGVPRTRRLHDRDVSDHLPRGPRCLPPPC